MFAQTTHVVAARHGFACVGIPATRLYIPSFIEIRSRVSDPQGVKIWPFPLLWLVAFTTACTTVQAVITLLINMLLATGTWKHVGLLTALLLLHLSFCLTGLFQVRLGRQNRTSWNNFNRILQAGILCHLTNSVKALKRCINDSIKNFKSRSH